MLAEGTDGLYRRAIMQSDPLGTLDGRDDMERKILDELNELPVDASLDEIRSKLNALGVGDISAIDPELLAPYRKAK